MTMELATGSAIADRFTTTVERRRLSEDDLRAHLATQDSGLLLLSLVHVTGDLELLDTFGPRVLATYDNRPFAFTTSADSQGAARDELIEMTVKALDRDPAEQLPYLKGDDLDDETFRRMMSLATGVELDKRWVAMLREQGGFNEARPIQPINRDAATRVHLAIIGAGMTGLAAAVSAADRGFDYTIFESGSEVGGVWAVNDYPGAGVDTPSVYYSLSFDLNPSWSRYYPIQSEYFQYLNDLADRFGLREHIKFRTEVLRLKWIEEDAEWEITTVENGRESRTIRATAVMTAAGHLNRPLYPDLNGRESFKGASWHANRWDHSVDLSGKRVGIIGAGATAVQIISKIASEVGHLTVFQRQPHWISPNAMGAGIIADDEIWTKENLPYYIHWSRLKAYWGTSDYNGYPMVRVDPEWAKDHLSISPANDAVMQSFLQYIDDCFGSDPELAKKVTPTYAPVGKRLVRDPSGFEPGGYYYALSLPHVDVETAKLGRVVPDGIFTVDGKLIELDVIIYSTGLTLDWISPIEVVGRDGVKLGDVWRDNNPSSYLGGMVPGFPNLFVNSGPNTGASHAGGHNFMAEVVDHFAMEALQLLVNESGRSVEVTQEAFEEYNRALDERMAGSIWAHERGAHTYYTNQKGRPILPTPFMHVEYWEMSRTPEEGALIVR
ncbi:flavin-containing monooxygenase [Rhodococcus sp. NPDC059968]|uniref:flavin-containing monooxygenase n=1 Tax=Rhodococcus sp. NPDC059968 TaxID=3347017 RepID=UPI00366BDA49